MAVELSPDLVEWWASPAGEAVVATASTLSWTPADSLSSTTHLRRLYPDLPPELLSGTIPTLSRHAIVPWRNSVRRPPTGFFHSQPSNKPLHMR